MLQWRRETNIFCNDIEFITLVSFVIAYVQRQDVVWTVTKKRRRKPIVKSALKGSHCENVHYTNMIR